MKFLLFTHPLPVILDMLKGHDVSARFGHYLYVYYTYSLLFNSLLLIPSPSSRQNIHGVRKLSLYGIDLRAAIHDAGPVVSTNPVTLGGECFAYVTVSDMTSIKQTAMNQGSRNELYSSHRFVSPAC
jgi:hypothetical protein